MSIAADEVDRTGGIQDESGVFDARKKLTRRPGRLNPCRFFHALGKGE